LHFIILDKTPICYIGINCNHLSTPLLTALSLAPYHQVFFSCLGVLGGCPRIETLLRKNPFWPFFPNIFVKERNYSPQMFEKTDSKRLSLATASILGQPPWQEATSSREDS